MSSTSPGVGPRYSQSEGLIGPREEGKTFELVLGGTGGGGGSALAGGDTVDSRFVETTSGG